MMAPRPPLFWQFTTFAAKVIVPRLIRQTLPVIDPATGVSPRPKSASAPVAVVRGEPSMGMAAYDAAPTVTEAAVWLPIGTVDSTPTPGPASSTSALNCEKDATALFTATAATETTVANPAGYSTALVPPLPAAAISRRPFL